MISRDRIKEVGKWAGATGTASVIGLVYLHSFIFPRTEAETLIEKVNKIEPRVESRLNRMEPRIERRLTSIETKLDEIQSMLIRKLADSPEKTPQQKAQKRNELYGLIDRASLSPQIHRPSKDSEPSRR